MRGIFRSRGLEQLRAAMVFWAAECGHESEPRQAGHPFAIREVTFRDNTVEEENKT